MPPPRSRAPVDNDAFAEAVFGGRPFVATAALKAGIVTEHELRSRYIRVLPGIYLTAGVPYDAYARVRAAWLWAPRDAVLAGAAAAMLHGENRVAPDEVCRAVDIYLPRTSPAPEGIRIRPLRRPLESSDFTERHSIRCTTVSRTALDLARWNPDPLRAVIAVDAVCNASGTPVPTVVEYALGTRGLHGRPRALHLLERCDHRADSPPETKLRLIIADSSLPKPEPQVEIFDSAGSKIATADLGYRAHKVALFYDGEHHLLREQRDWDSNVTARLFDEGWLDLRITGGMLRDKETLRRRIAEKLRRQGCTDV